MTRSLIRETRYSEIIDGTLFLGPEAAATSCVQDHPDLLFAVVRCMEVPPIDGGYCAAFDIPPAGLEDLVQAQNHGLQYYFDDDVDGDGPVGRPRRDVEPRVLSDRALHLRGFADTVDQGIQVAARTTAEFISDYLKSKDRAVYVHCAAGISRSAAMVVAYLMLSQKMPLESALAHVHQRRSLISPNAGFVAQLMEIDAEVQGKPCCFDPDTQKVRDIVAVCGGVDMCSEEKAKRALEAANGDTNSAVGLIFSRAIK